MKKVLVLTMAAITASVVLGLAMLPGAEATGNPNKVVVCKYVSTPGGVLDHIVIVDDNTLGNATQPWPGTLPFIWTDAQGQTTVGSIAIRYAMEGEQAHDVPLSECPQTPPPTSTSPPPVTPPSASLSTPVCTNTNIVATGVNPTDASVTFDVFVNGVLVDSFIVAANSQGTSAAIPVKDNDVVTVKVQGSETVLDTETVNLECATSSPPPTSPPPTSPPPTQPPPTQPPPTEPPTTPPPVGGPGPGNNPPPNNPPVQGPPLAFTGPEAALPIGALAVALATAGTGLMWLSRKRRDDE